MAGDLRAGKLRPRWRQAAMAGELRRRIGASCGERIGRRPPLSLSSAGGDLLSLSPLPSPRPPTAS
jgi:hypothetical protein